MGPSPGESRQRLSSRPQNGESGWILRSPSYLRVLPKFRPWPVGNEEYRPANSQPWRNTRADDGPPTVSSAAVIQQQMTDDFAQAPCFVSANTRDLVSTGGRAAVAALDVRKGPFASDLHRKETTHVKDKRRKKAAGSKKRTHRNARARRKYRPPEDWPELTEDDARGLMKMIQFTNERTDIVYPGLDLQGAISFAVHGFAVGDVDSEVQPIVCVDYDDSIWIVTVNVTTEYHTIPLGEVIFDPFLINHAYIPPVSEGGPPGGTSVTMVDLRIAGAPFILEPLGSPRCMSAMMVSAECPYLPIARIREKALWISAKMHVDGIEKCESCVPVVFDKMPDFEGSA